MTRLTASLSPPFFLEGARIVGKKMASLALFLGAFLIALAALSKFYMYDRLAVAPANTESVSTSQTASGSDGEYLDVSKLEVATAPLRSVRTVAGDVEASEKASKELGKDVDVWRTYVCTDTTSFDCSSGKTPLSGTQDVVAFDAHTGETVDWSGASSTTGGQQQSGGFEGLYFKFPFGAEKKTYKFWDGTLREATDAEFVKETSLKGMKAYEYRQTIEPTKTGTIDVPGTLVGSDEGTVTADRMYSTVRTFVVDPVTGVILKGGEQQDSYLAVDGERKLTTTKAALTYTDDYVQETVDEYKSKATLLTIVDTTFPVVGGVVGLVLLVLGGLGLARAGRREDGHHVTREHAGASA